MVDVTISNPTLQAKKKIESEIINAIKTNVDENVDVKINLKVEKPAVKENPNQIRGKEIPNIKNIIAIASGKGGVGKQSGRGHSHGAHPSQPPRPPSDGPPSGNEAGGAGLVRVPR